MLRIVDGQNVYDLLNIINQNVSLPEFVFNKPFEQYLFFDADIFSSKYLIGEIQKIVEELFGTQSSVYVFSASTKDFLGVLSAHQNWSEELFAYFNRLQDMGNHYGLILIDASMKWVVYQLVPANIGVFAFNSAVDVSTFSPESNDNFFDCEQISGWLSQKTLRDKEIVEGLGKNYLSVLFKSYQHSHLGRA